MSDQTTKPDLHEEVTNIDSILASVDVIEADTKKGDKRYKFIRLTTDSGKVVNWYPFLRSTVPDFLAELEATKK